MNSPIKKHDVVIHKRYAHLPSAKRDPQQMLVTAITPEGHLKLLSLENPAFHDAGAPEDYCRVNNFPNPLRPGDVVHKMRYDGKKGVPTQRLGKVTQITPHHVYVGGSLFHHTHWEKHTTNPTNEAFAGTVLTTERT